MKLITRLLFAVAIAAFAIVATMISGIYWILIVMLIVIVLMVAREYGG